MGRAGLCPTRTWIDMWSSRLCSGRCSLLKPLFDAIVWTWEVDFERSSTTWVFTNIQHILQNFHLLRLFGFFLWETTHSWWCEFGAMSSKERSGVAGGAELPSYLKIVKQPDAQTLSMGWEDGDDFGLAKHFVSDSGDDKYIYIYIHDYTYIYIYIHYYIYI